MRKQIMAAGCVVLFGCGSSASPSDGSSTPPAQAPGDVPVNQGQTPSDNANNTPPVGGAAPSGVFVSTSLGSDLGTGSQLNPFKKLADAITLAKAQSLPVNACAETYAEAVTLVDGVSMFGYFDCKNGWARIATNASIVSPTSPALLAKNITLATRVAGFDVKAPDFDTMKAADAPSSIALSISDSTNLTFTSITAHAGTGAQGEDGTAAPIGSATFSTPEAYKDQFDPCATSGGIGALLTPQFCTTPSLKPSSRAGRGGTSGCTVGVGTAGGASGAPRIFKNGTVLSDVDASMPPPNGQPGSGPSGGTGGVNGGDGGPGGDGAPGTDGANGQWLLSADGFVVGSGAPGSIGVTGSGGGGGGATMALWFMGTFYAQPTNSTFYDSATGAGGGAGGCPGAAGTPGSGGGASIAALVAKSMVTFEQSRLESSTGGRAGRGALGTAGVAGQAAPPGWTDHTLPTALSPSVPVHVTGAGGHGGAGGRGGVSGHGAPGPSFALAFSGTHPTLTATDLAPGPAGGGQPELDGVGTIPAVTGVSLAEYMISQ